MKKEFYFSIAFLLIGFFVIPFSVHADTYVIHFYYDNQTKTLSFDKYTEKVVERDEDGDMSIVEFAYSETTGPYILKLFDVQGNEFSTSEFDKKNGEFKLVIPYFSIANKLVVIEKLTNKEILSADLSTMVTCNSNGTCEPGVGETVDNCVEDCGKQLMSPPVVEKNDSTFSYDTPAYQEIDVTANEIDDVSSKQSVAKMSLWERIMQFFRNLWNAIVS